MEVMAPSPSIRLPCFVDVDVNVVVDVVDGERTKEFRTRALCSLVANGVEASVCCCCGRC